MTEGGRGVHIATGGSSTRGPVIAARQAPHIPGTGGRTVSNGAAATAPHRDLRDMRSAHLAQPSQCPSDPAINSDINTFVQLKLVVPTGKKEEMGKILKPFTKRVKGLIDVVNAVEQSESLHPASVLEPRAPHYSITGGELNSPCLAVMLFVPEIGRYPYKDVRQKFLKLPWRHHHTIQLQRSTSLCVVGKQEFFFLSRQLPLWSVCPSMQDSCKVRFNLFVRRFNAMVEFYRLLTGTEMESSKSDFCLFPLNIANTNEDSTPTTYELALKHCSNVSPYSVTDAYLTFPVRDMPSIRAVLHTDVTDISNNRHVTHDPDGNVIILYDVTADRKSPEVTSEAPLVSSRPSRRVKELADKASVHSGSIDSGRFSDFDARSAELDHYMNKLVKTCNLDGAKHDDNNLSGFKADHIHRKSSAKSSFGSSKIKNKLSIDLNVPGTIFENSSS